VSFSYLNRIKNKFCKIASINVFNIVEVAERFFNKILFEDQNITSNKDSLKHWKNKIFYIIAVFMITFGAPLLFYGAYMFYRRGDIVYAISEILIYIIIVIVITRRSLSVKSRKIFIIVALYLISLFLLITAGILGGGMICVFFSLILSGCLLEKKQILHAVTINIIIFIALTALLMYGYFDGTYMETYKDVWLINALTAQVCGIILIFLMNTIYHGLENQTQLIKESKESFAASELKHKAMIANISDVIAIIDINGSIEYNSTNIGRSFGWGSEDFCNKIIWEMIHPEDRERIRVEFHSLIEKDRYGKKMESRFLCRDGTIKDIELTAVNMANDPNINGILINFHDITDRKKKEDENLYLSYHDVLTGIYNRRFYEEEIKRLDTERNLPISIIIGDVNGLKLVNDAFGHDKGDELLQKAATVIQSACRTDDVVARWGGDEFVILLPRTNTKEAEEIVERIKELYSDVYVSAIRVSISFGWDAKKETHHDILKVLKSAEDNMYKHKIIENGSMRDNTISTIIRTLHEKNPREEQHSQRVSEICQFIGKAMGLSRIEVSRLKVVGLLHDIGKIAIEEGILNKPGKLTEQERNEINRHPDIGYRILNSSFSMLDLADCILAHHERWDGAGYPKGLKGDAIPMVSRIIALADTYDAMTSERSYRNALSEEEALAEIRKNIGTQFDPEIARIFIEKVLNQQCN